MDFKKLKINLKNLKDFAVKEVLDLWGTESLVGVLETTLSALLEAHNAQDLEAVAAIVEGQGCKSWHKDLADYEHGSPYERDVFLLLKSSSKGVLLTAEKIGSMKQIINFTICTVAEVEARIKALSTEGGDRGQAKIIKEMILKNFAGARRVINGSTRADLGKTGSLTSEDLTCVRELLFAFTMWLVLADFEALLIQEELSGTALSSVIVAERETLMRITGYQLLFRLKKTDKRVADLMKRNKRKSKISKATNIWELPYFKEHGEMRKTEVETMKRGVFRTTNGAIKALHPHILREVYLPVDFKLIPKLTMLDPMCREYRIISSMCAALSLNRYHVFSGDTLESILDHFDTKNPRVCYIKALVFFLGRRTEEIAPLSTMGWSKVDDHFDQISAMNFTDEHEAIASMHMQELSERHDPTVKRQEVAGIGGKPRFVDLFSDGRVV